MSHATRIITTKGFVEHAADINFYCRNQRLLPRHTSKFKLICSASVQRVQQLIQVIWTLTTRGYKLRASGPAVPVPPALPSRLGYFRIASLDNIKDILLGYLFLDTRG